MKKWVIIVFVLGMVSCSDCSGPEIADERMKEQARAEANQMSSAYLDKDFQEFVSYSPQILIEGIGGTAKYMEYLVAFEEQNQREGTEIIDIQIGEVLHSSIKGNSIQLLLEQEVQRKNADGVSIRRDSLIAVKEGRTSSWKFLNVGGAGDSILRFRYPYLHEDWNF